VVANVAFLSTSIIEYMCYIGQARAYLRIDTYVRAGRPLMDAMGIKTIFLVTDSKGAVDEAMKCAVDHPDVCSDITFRFLDKKRWVGAEGGWENPFPSGDSRIELLDIQLEFALAQRSAMGIFGDSNYANKIHAHMCCGYPLSQRGMLPQRCICPPVVQLQQVGFDCERGNKLLCVDPTGVKKGGDITRPLDDPKNMLAANMSLNADAFIQATGVCLIAETIDKICYTPTESESTRKYKISKFVETSMTVACADYDNGPRKRKFCTKE
jgi:hypothetical protein